MSEVDIGPINCGGSRPYAVDPEYRSACVCDIEWAHHEPVEVGDGYGRSNAAALKQAGHKLGNEVEHVCDDCYERISEIPLCPGCGHDQEEAKRGVWVCINSECPLPLPEEEN